ncbi:MAG: c-type cytochrome [Pyrinomonadaceae bacterium]
MKLITVIAFVTLCSLLWACGNAATTPNTANSAQANANTAASTPAPAASPADELAAGRKLYKINCANCHRDDGTGGRVTIEGKTLNPDNLTDEKRKKLTDEKILAVIHEGIEDEGMPAYKDRLTEAEIREILRYVRTELQKQPAANANSR